VALDVYRRKRKFKATPEPRGRKGRRGGNRYVIQKHAARRLHYDLRLELDGVMKSWAVTRGPSLNPGDKRLAVHVEDHPIEYNSFEGTIPQGEYGGGTVMIWDRGRWIPEGDPHAGYAKGHLSFELDGEKLHGHWHLVRMSGRGKRERRENWLLIKGKDADARGQRGKDILQEKPLSVASGRSIEEIAEGKGKRRVWQSNRGKDEGARSEKRDGRSTKRDARASAAAAKEMLRKSTRGSGARLPDFVPPSLASLHADAPRGKDWLHEIKFDGYRIEARLDNGAVRLLTRNRQDWTHRFMPIADAVASLPAKSALLDGELVVEDDKGISSFSLLQTDLKQHRGDRLVYYVFDLLHHDGRNLCSEPLVERKAALETLLKTTKKNGNVRYTEDSDEDGQALLKHACRMGLEGIVSKRREAPYRSGRSENFIKSKCHNVQEFVVAGFSPSTAQRAAVGALTVAVHDNGRLRYAGRVGTGYTRETAHDLWQRLDKLRVARAPIALPKDERRKDVIWVKPQLVIEAEFRGVTHSNVLRQASYKGLREDKPAREVVQEKVVSMAQRQAVRKSDRATARRPPASETKSTNAKTGGARGSADLGHVRLTHPDRVYWVDVGVTKEDLAEYYLGVWDWMAPHIVGRPLALVRCPDGTKGECFFQKHIAANVKSSPLRHAVDAKERDVIAVENADDLIALVQSGALEIHTRGSRLDDLERCDRAVFDLDPGEGVDWPQIVAAAREVRERLAGEKLESFVKLSGGKGIHVVVPIEAVDWDRCKAFTQRIALAMAADSPQRYIGKMTKSLRKQRIFIDYFRNSREATSVAPYSTRARAGAAVSAPLSWQQLGRSESAGAFTVLNLKKHFRHDPWADIGKVRQRLPKDG
jgi:bifunctional non-homologous end joining protein LigD